MIFNNATFFSVFIYIVTRSQSRNAETVYEGIITDRLDHQVPKASGLAQEPCPR